jgi:hypothetical protein
LIKHLGLNVADAQSLRAALAAWVSTDYRAARRSAH